MYNCENLVKSVFSGQCAKLHYVLFFVVVANNLFIIIVFFCVYFDGFVFTIFENIRFYSKYKAS